MTSAWIVTILGSVIVLLGAFSANGKVTVVGMIFNIIGGVLGMLEQE